MKEKQEDLQKFVEKFFEDARPLFGEGKERGLLVVAVDRTVGDDQVALTGAILGKRDEIVMGVERMMDKSEEVCGVINDAVNFRKFKKSPVNGLVSAFSDILDKIGEDMAKKRAEKEKETAAEAEEE